MPLPTTLQFYRKKQNVEHLFSERPQNLESFYDAMEEAVLSVEHRLRILEQEFCCGGTVEAEIKQWLPHLDAVMADVKTQELFCKPQIQDLISQYEKSLGDPTMDIWFNREAIAKVVELIDKIIGCLRKGFTNIIEAIMTMLEFLKKYCQSFSQTDGDIYLETATNYEKQRRDYANAITLNLTDIHDMADLFESSQGKRIYQFGSVPKKIAERCECEYVPFLVMFPAACENVRNACTGIRMWLQADKGYPTFIQNNIADLEIKRDELSKAHREMQLKFSNLDHKIKLLKRDIGECDSDLRRLENREASLRTQEREIIEEIRETKLDIEIKEMRKVELKKMISLTQKEKDTLEQLIADLESLSHKKPSLNRKMAEVQKKLSFVNSRRDDKENYEEKLRDCKIERKSMKSEIKTMETELQRRETNITKLKEIHKYKTNPEILKKIFHNMPLITKHVTGYKKKGKVIDKLEKATQIVAANIEQDWMKLYRNLPFFPPRGEQNLQNDIDEIWKNFMRENSQTQAKHILTRWRRLHNRASIDNLKEALILIKRKDVIDRMIEEFNRLSRLQKQGRPTPSPYKTERTSRHAKRLLPVMT